MAFDHVAVIKFHGHLVFMILILLCLQAGLLMQVVSSSYIISKPGCRNKCGNISIPYPFGIGDENCFLDKSFNITCNETVNPPKASFYVSNRELLDIDLQGQFRMNGIIASNCYNKEGNVRTTGSIGHTSLWGKRFTFSDTRNKIVAIGCDTIAVMRGDERNYLNGCISTCINISDVINGSCIGIGCCQAPILKGQKTYRIDLTTQSNHDKVWYFNPCSYGFLVDQNWFKFSSIDLYDNQNRTEVPVVIDWSVGGSKATAGGGYETCEEAKTGNNYACGGNSDCYDLLNGDGYRCNCWDGYEGNPYLINGCKDINECDDESREISCAYGNLCTNTVGNYTCACPSGYYGDGRKQGIGCLREREWPDSPDKQENKAFIIFGGIGIGITVVLLLAFGFWLYRRLQERKQIKLKQHYFNKNGGLLLKQKISAHGMEKDKIFVIEELEKATDNFNQSRIIGKGGFGTVYKGMLSDGKIVAIKKSRLIDESQVDQFINEVAILSQIIHRHAVKLIGCCLETHVPLLVYEYVSNGTLSQHLHSEGYVSSISWKDRLRIATEIARALAYMHSEASIPIFHRDIKSSNILLDETYRAKVSDFGLSRSVPIEQTHLTTVVLGTFGYLDPEYFHSGQFTDKSDVYSFGVVLLELLTGERAISEQKSLAMHFISALREDRLFDILEARVYIEGDKDEVMIVAKIAKSCLKLNGKKRPLMKEVASSLERLRKFQEEPWVQPTMLQEEDFLVGVASSCCTTLLEVDDYDDSNSLLMST